MPYAADYATSLSFSPEPRAALATLTRRFRIGLSYIRDHAGDEVLGLVPTADDAHGVAIAYPIDGGFCAEDDHLTILGVFQTVEDLCSALNKHLANVCAQLTLH